VRLLTSGPGHPTTTTAGVSYASTMATTTTNIRPRGLINSGNMCFANSVLQIMVYCPPFHRLFAELGMVLGGVGLSGVAGTSAHGASVYGTSAHGTSANGTAAEASAYPLVEATVEFLREFVVDDKSKDLKEKGKANASANINGKVASGSASGSGSSSRTSSSRGGKGKERERGDSVNDASGGGAVGRREDEDGWTESFLPTYVYDAMQVKKRFEHMRVSFPLVSSFFLVLFLLVLSLLVLCLLVLMTILISRAATKKTPKNSSVFISTRWKKRSWRCWQLFLLLHLFLQVQVRRILRRGRTRNLDLLLAPAPPTPIRSPNRTCRMRMPMEMDGGRLGSGIGRLLRVRYVFLSFLFFFGLAPCF
jgi:hypothetical protein